MTTLRITTVLMAIIAHLVFSLPAATFAAEPAKILLAHGAISNNVAPLWIAKEQGFYRKYGLDVDLVFIIAGRATQAMMAGQVPVGLVGATHVTNVVTAGGDLVMILGLQNTLDYLFIARPCAARNQGRGRAERQEGCHWDSLRLGFACDLRGA